MRKIRYCMVLFLVLNLFLSCSSKQDSGHTPGQSTENTETDKTAIDPVCNMKVEKTDAQWTVEHNGETYYFCMEQHKDDFLVNPEQYLDQK